MGEVTKEINRGGSTDFPPMKKMKPTEYGRFIVVSLGTGSAKIEEKYNANEVAEWGIVGWLTSGESTPLVDVFTQASGDMVDLHLGTIFQAIHSEDNYLRIQA